MNGTTFVVSFLADVNANKDQTITMVASLFIFIVDDDRGREMRKEK